MDFAARLTGRDVFQRNIFIFVFYVGEHGVALVEGTAARVLSGKTNWHALLYQAGEGQSFRHPVVDRTLAGTHLGALVKQFLHFRVNVETFRIRRQRCSELRQLFERNSSLHFKFRLVAAAIILVPIFGQVAHGRFLLERAGFFLGGFELGFDCSGLGLGIGCTDVISVNFPQGRMFFDLFVEQRLRDGGIVHLAVAMATIPDQVDHHVSAEGVAVFGGQASHAQCCVHILAVHVEDGNGLAASDASCEASRMLFEVARSESQKIIDDDVDRAAHGVALEVGIVHGLGENALPGECRVAVND